MNPALHTPAPRHYLSGPSTASATLPDAGLPQDRHARIAARRAFVELKQRFMSAVASLSGMRGDWLRYQVRQAHEPVDLWLLRSAVFDALAQHDHYHRRTRNELRRALDSVFPDSGELLPFGNLL